MAKPIVAIVGKPNVGKSTLFNRIVGDMVSIVEGIPGITRDRLYQDADWGGKEFTLVDTGGLDFSEQGEIISNIRKQVEIAINEADVILFVVDARMGLTATDQSVAALLRKSGKPVILVANKVERFDGLQDFYEFYKLGLGDPIPISAIEGLNTGDLLDSIITALPHAEIDAAEHDMIRIAVIGRPNVGKSSLVNAIIGQERAIVSNIPGTTRDAIDTYVKKDNRIYNLVDTAGMRRKSKIELDTTERYSVIRSLRAVDRSQVVLMLIDATQGVTEQDKKIVGYAHEKGKASILVINKWDLIEKNERTASQYTKEIKDALLFLSYAPIVFVSALTKQRIHRILEMVDTVMENYCLRVSTPGIKNLIKEAVMHSPPPSYKDVYKRQGVLCLVTQTRSPSWTG